MRRNPEPSHPVPRTLSVTYATGERQTLSASWNLSRSSRTVRRLLVRAALTRQYFNANESLKLRGEI